MKRDTQERADEDRGSSNHRGDILFRVSALAGAAAAFFLASRRRGPGAWTGATAVALPLATRGITGRWPLQETLTPSDPVEVRAVFTIMRPAVEIHDRWRRLEELPSILRHVREVREVGNGRSSWRAETPAGEVEWEAEIVEEKRPEILRWQSLPGSEVDHAGEVVLKPLPGGQGTRMNLTIRIGRGSSFESNGSGGGGGGALQGMRKAVAALVQPALELEVEEDIRRFKSLVEAGEIPTTEGQPSGERKALALSNPF